MKHGIQDKVALITGAAGGIGSATARLFAAEGARLVLVDRYEMPLEALGRELRSQGAEVLTRQLDVTDPQRYEEVVAAADAHFGGIDLLASVAGGGLPQTLKTMRHEDWMSVVNLNLSGPFNGIHAVHASMRRRGGGAIVTVASLAALRMSLNNGISYTAAKSGLLGLTRHAAFELGPDNIRVNAVLPGPVLTGQIEAKMAPDRIEKVARELPLGRWVRPEEVAASILFFCSDLSSACTGTHVVIDCGMHIGAPVSREEYLRHRDQGPLSTTQE